MTTSFYREARRVMGRNAYLLIMNAGDDRRFMEIIRARLAILRRNIEHYGNRWQALGDFERDNYSMENM